MGECPELETWDTSPLKPRNRLCVRVWQGRTLGGVFAPASDAENYTIDSVWRFTQKR